MPEQIRMNVLVGTVGSVVVGYVTVNKTKRHLSEQKEGIAINVNYQRNETSRTLLLPKAVLRL